MTGSPTETEFHFEPLASGHDRAAFCCGVAALDRYIEKQARQDMKKGVAAVYVLTPDGKTIAGYYALSQYSIKLRDLPPEVAKKLPKYPAVPATLLGRLAVSQEFRGRRLGEHLLFDALRQCLSTSKLIASVAVVVDTKDDSGACFYKKYGFQELPNIARRLFLPMATVEMMFDSNASR